MKLANLKVELDKILKVEMAYDWDNVGLLIGDMESEIKSITLSLELSEDVINDAVKNGSNLIITHHPLIFSPFKQITSNDIKQKLAMELIKNGIALYAAHTNFDRLKDGLNDYVIRLLEVENVEDFYLEDDGYYIGKVASLKNEMQMADFVRFVSQKLQVNDIRLVSQQYKTISRVALVTGSGASYIEEANKVADLLITGDIKYHDAQDAYQRGDTALDAGHFGTEKFFPSAMEIVLNNSLDTDIPIYKSMGLSNPFRQAGF